MRNFSLVSITGSHLIGFKNNVCYVVSFVVLVKCVCVISDRGFSLFKETGSDLRILSDVKGEFITLGNQRIFNWFFLFLFLLLSYKCTVRAVLIMLICPCLFCNTLSNPHWIN